MPKTVHEDAQARPPNLRERFRQFAAHVSVAAGSPWTFLGAVAFLLLWSVSYPLFIHFPEPLNTWQLVVNTVTTIVTFLMVFLIQNAQNRDARALHLKIDELLRAMRGARNQLVNLEDLTDEELEKLRKEFERIQQTADGKLRHVTGQHLAHVESESQRRETDA